MTLGDFQVSFQELAGHYVANSTTMTYAGEVTLSYLSSSQSESFQIVQDLSSTAEIQFVLPETSLERFLSFLKLPQSMADINVPLVGSLHNAPNVDKIGFILKQDAYDSAGLYLKSLFFQVSKLYRQFPTVSAFCCEAFSHNSQGEHFQSKIVDT